MQEGDGAEVPLAGLEDGSGVGVPEGVALPRTITMNLACTSLGLTAVTSDLGALDKRAQLLLARHSPGYLEIIASELPLFVRESVALVFGRQFATLLSRRCQRAAAALGMDVRVREELTAPTARFAMLYLRYVADESDSWDETKEHEGLATRDKDPRKSLHVEDVPLPELGPGEAFVAMMASAINYNTVWTSIFEPVSTFAILERYGRM